MHRQHLLNLLHNHQPTDAYEQAMTQETIAFVKQHSNCFERSLLIGHITGSAWVVSPDRTQVLLIHHRKLDRWLQPGGHADGDPNVANVALREAQEETGLTRLTLVAGLTGEPEIFDVDIHPIPARGEVPAHLHYDIRFLVEADPIEPFGESDEIKGIRWCTIAEAKRNTTESSIGRMLEKIG